MSDILTRLINDQLNIRAYTVITLNTAKHITKLHNTTPNATIALGRTITATALLSATLKPGSDQSILVKFSGTGPLEEISVQADAKGNIRGYVANPGVDTTNNIGELNTQTALGQGYLTVSKDLGMKEPYKNISPFLSGNIAKEITYYLSKSEQVPSALLIGLNLNKEGVISSSGGILIQTFPDTPSEIIDTIENNLQLLPDNLGNELEKGTDIHAVLATICGDKPLTILQQTPLQAACRCSKEMLYPILANVQKEELEDMIEKEGGAELTCTFCTSKYYFDKNELLTILEHKKNN